MQTLKLDGNGVVRVIEAADPTPGPDEVVIETVVSAICGSEMRTYRGSGAETGNTGHEGAGIVVHRGRDVREPKVAQRVGVSAVVGCGQCGYCREGRFTWCPKRRGYGSMHAERFVIAARACHPLPDDIPWDVGVLVSGDGFGVPFHTSTKIADPRIRSVAVFGAGPIGLGSVLLQSFLGRRVIAVELAPFRLEFAKRLGAAEVVDASGGDAVERIRALTDGAGVDVAIEAAGRPETVKQCFAAVHPGGTVVFNGEQGPVPLSPSEDFIRRDITAVGSWFYHFREFDEMVSLYRQGLCVQTIVSHRYPLAQADEAYAQFAAAQTGKVLLQMKSES